MSAGVTLNGGPTVDDEVAHLVPGLALPSRALASTQGGTVNVGQLARAVVFVYPWSGQPGLPNPPDWDTIPGAHGSTPQAHGYGVLFGQFAAKGYDVFGLSTQPTPWQRELSDRLGLPFALLSDDTFEFADAVRLPRFATGGVSYLKRATLVVHDGTLAAVMYPVADPASNAAVALAMVSAWARP